MNIFEQAVRQKLRIPSAKGELTVEQLWDLPLQSKTQFDLDTLAKAANRELKGMDEESFVSTTDNPAKAKLELTLDILKHVIAAKMSDAEAAKNRAARAEEREKLLKILADKQNAALGELSVEQIQERLKALG